MKPEARSRKPEAGMSRSGDAKLPEDTISDLGKPYLATSTALGNLLEAVCIEGDWE
jgi:hypothetical protein